MSRRFLLVLGDGTAVGSWPAAAAEEIAAYGFEAPYAVPTEGQVDYRHTYVKTDFPEDRWVTAREIRPTAPQVTRREP